MNLGKINTQQKFSCPHCSAFIDAIDPDTMLEENLLTCPACGNKIKLPDRVIEKLARRKTVGTNIDICC